MESTCTCTESQNPGSRGTKEGKKNPVQFHTTLVSAQDCGDTDVTMSQMQCWRKEKSCLWDGNCGVGERVSETPWKIQKNLLSIDGPSLSVRGWTSLELECKEMRLTGWKYYWGGTGPLTGFSRIGVRTRRKFIIQHEKGSDWVVSEVMTDWNMFCAKIKKYLYRLSFSLVLLQIAGID